MNADEKRIQSRMLVKRASSNIKRYIEKLDQSQREYIEQAKRAKQQGIQSQYRLARSGLAMCIRQRRVAEQLLLNLELNQQTKDASEITSQFVSGMTVLGKEINSINGRIDVSGAKKQMRRAMSKNEQLRANLEGFMDESEMMFGDMSSDVSLDSELDAMINREINADNGAMNADIDAEIDSMLRSVSNKN